MISNLLVLAFVFFSPLVFAQEAERVGEIDPSETDRYSTRFEAKRYWQFGLGPFFPINLGQDGFLYQISAGHHWDVHAMGELFAKSQMALGNEADSFYATAQIGGTFFPLPGIISPTLGAAFGAAGATAKTRVFRFGFAGSVFCGVRLFRISQTQLDVQLQYNRLFTFETGGDPSILGGQVAILF